MTVGTTRSKRRLGRYLRPYLERSGLKVDELADRARCARQTASRLFTGANLPRYHLFTALLAELDVTGEARDRALELWEIADADTVAIEYAGALSPVYMRFRMDESEAVRERTIDPVILPGPLQTAAYSRAISQASRRRSSLDADTGVVDRHERSSLLTRPEHPLAFHAVLDEVTLRRMVGGPEVMAEQLAHLVEMSKRPNVTIQVVPFSAGAYGAHAGAVVLIGFPEEDEQDAAYVESPTGQNIVEKQEDVATLSAVWDGAAAVALPAVESVKMIKALQEKGP